MPWSRPAARMREFVLAIKAIFQTWETGERLEFRGEFYEHTLMTPFFNPGPNPHGWPPIFIAGVGPKMTEAAGEVADGMLLHPFHTERSLEQVMLPNLQKGLEASGRDLSDFTLCAQVLVVTGKDDAEDVTGRRLGNHGLGFGIGLGIAIAEDLEVHAIGRHHDRVGLEARLDEGPFGIL